MIDTRWAAGHIQRPCLDAGQLWLVVVGGRNGTKTFSGRGGWSSISIALPPLHLCDVDTEYWHKLSARERSIVDFLECTRSPLIDGSEQVVDLAPALDRICNLPTSSGGSAPCIVPGSRLWLRRERRLLTATECGRLQGLQPDSRDDLADFGEGDYMDLVGNAFAGNVIAAVLLGLFAVAPGLDTQASITRAEQATRALKRVLSTDTLGTRKLQKVANIGSDGGSDASTLPLPGVEQSTSTNRSRSPVARPPHQTFPRITPAACIDAQQVAAEVCAKHRSAKVYKPRTSIALLASCAGSLVARAAEHFPHKRTLEAETRANMQGRDLAPWRQSLQARCDSSARIASSPTSLRMRAALQRRRNIITPCLRWQSPQLPRDQASVARATQRRFWHRISQVAQEVLRRQCPQQRAPRLKTRARQPNTAWSMQVWMLNLAASPSTSLHT